MGRKTRPHGKPPSERGAMRPNMVRIGKGPTTPIEPGDNCNGPRLVATHEAGHAVASVVLGLNLESVDIKRRTFSDGVSLGYTKCPCRVEDVRGKGEAAAFPRLIQMFAGPLAEARLDPDDDAWQAGYSSDMGDAQRLGVMAVCEAADDGRGHLVVSPEELERKRTRLDALMARALEAAERFVADHADAIEAVADALLSRTILTGAEVAAIVGRAEAEARPARRVELDGPWGIAAGV